MFSVLKSVENVSGMARNKNMQVLYIAEFGFQNDCIGTYFSIAIFTSQY